jgi:aldehyde:ferredoxin oxidoreductase
MNGVWGRYLLIDASTADARTVEIPEDVQRRFIGGVGLGAWLMNASTPPDTDALAPEAPIAFMFSPLVGTPLTTSAKFAVVAKSPLTGMLNDALASSHFAIAGKRTGHDAIVISGHAAQPSVIVVDEDGVRIEAAPDLWGTPAQEAESALRARLGGGYRAAAIGPAGERLIPFATVSHDGRHAGRGGHGAVLGSKNIKAVVVRGVSKVPVHDPDAVLSLAADLRERSFGPATEKYRELGTLANLLTFNALSTLPTRNFQDARFEGTMDLSPEAAEHLRGKTRQHCANCSIGCGHIYASSKGGVRLEYQNVFALGPMCGVSDRDAVSRASQRCDELGLDTISAGGTIAFAMECAERGLIDEPWLRFGSASALLLALDLIETGEDVGALLRLGSRGMAQRVGSDAIAFAPQVKGLEMPGYEPRTLQTMALGLAVNARGADHNRSGAYEADFSEEVDRLAGDARSAAACVRTEDDAALIDSMILCKFLRGVFVDKRSEWAALLRAVTGADYDADELSRIAAGIVTEKKRYNLEQGWRRSDDTLPPRLLNETLLTDGGTTAALTQERLDAMIDEYYRLRGWDENGLPPHAPGVVGLRSAH